MKLNNKPLIELLSYSIVSAIGLAVDYGTSYTLHLMGLNSVLSGTVGYSIGLIVVYPLLILFTYKTEKVVPTVASFLIFSLSGLLGIFTTWFVMGAVIKIFAWDFHLAKISAVAFSFILVFIFRKIFVFRTLK